MKDLGARRALTALCIVAAACVACGAPPTAGPGSDIVPLLELGERWAAPGSPVELTYRFDVGPDTPPLDADYEVSVDFVQESGEVLVADDHLPPTPTSSWVPGSVVEYRRVVFLPHDAEPGPTTVELALRDPESGRRIALAGSADDAVSQVGHLAVDASDPEVPITYESGWYGFETDPSAPAARWQWSEDSAIASFPHPGTDAILYLRAETHVLPERRLPEVRVRVGPGPGHVEVARFRVERVGPFLERVYLPAKIMGGGDTVEVALRTDSVVVPAEEGMGSDPRSLGLRVFNLHVEPQPARMSFYLEPMNPLPRGNATESHRGDYVFTEDWFSGNIRLWQTVLASYEDRPNINYLEVGVFEGRSYTWMAENVFTHPTSTLTGIDLFGDFGNVRGETVRARFLENVRRAGVTDRSTLYTGYSQIELRKLPFAHYDVIYVDGGHDAATVLEDAMLTRRLLRDGGLIIFDDYEWEVDPGVRVATDMVLQIYGEEYSIVHRGYQLVLRKGPRP